MACTLAKMAGADFVKTSTGFGPAGATAHDVALMRAAVGPDMGVKASGGIRTLEDLQSMAAAGATRIGASASVKIVEATAACRKRSHRGVSMATPRANPQSVSASAPSCSTSCWKCRAATSETLDLDQLLANVAEIVKDVMPYDLFAILLYSERQRGLRIRYADRPSRRSGPQPGDRAGRRHHRRRGAQPRSRCWWAMCATIRAT